MASPTASNLATAVGDMVNAYADAAGRSPADSTDLGSGNIGGATLTPGLYTWSNPVNIGSDLTLDGLANDTWIFQVTGDLNVNHDAQVILTGGAQAKNVIWQVSGGVTLGTNSLFTGIVLSLGDIAMNNGAAVNGKLLTQTQVTLDRSTITDIVL